MESPTALRQRAERYRRMALTITDPRATEALDELAVAYEAQAVCLEAEQRIVASQLKK